LVKLCYINCSGPAFLRHSVDLKLDWDVTGIRLDMRIKWAAAGRSWTAT